MMFTMRDRTRQAIKGITIVQLKSETAFKGLLCIDLTGMTDDTDVISDSVVEVTACGFHVTSVLVDSLVDEAVDHVIFSVGACVVVVEFVKCGVVELAVVDDTIEFIFGAVVVAFVAVVVSIRLQRGS